MCWRLAAFSPKLRAASRLGERLLLTIPFAARWHFIPYDYWRFTPSSLNHLLTAAGFHSVRVYARGNACTVACYKVMTLLLLLLMPQTASKISRSAASPGGLGVSALVRFAGCGRESIPARPRRRRLPRLYSICRSLPDQSALNRFPSHHG